MKKVAVYTGTRNLYSDMVTASKSLVANSNVDKIYMFIEDDEFPYSLPKCVETINVSGQKFFNEDCVNKRSDFTYMALLRVCYSKYIPDDVVLQLDVDTIVVDDINSLWDVDLTNKYFAAVPEDLSTYKPYGPLYYNAGVMLINLKKTREDGLDELLIDFLNKREVPYIDQDAWNRFGVSKSVKLPVRYNESFVTGYTDEPAIVHYAGFRDWQTNPRVSRREYIKKYKESSK